MSERGAAASKNDRTAKETKKNGGKLADVADAMRGARVARLERYATDAQTLRAASAARKQRHLTGSHVCATPPPPRPRAISNDAVRERQAAPADTRDASDALFAKVREAIEAIDELEAEHASGATLRGLLQGARTAPPTVRVEHDLINWTKGVVGLANQLREHEETDAHYDERRAAALQAYTTAIDALIAFGTKK